MCGFPNSWKAWAGWQSTLGTIGMYDLASGYQAERDANPGDPSSCSTWPESVIDRYRQENIQS